jgi:hypothetical protein
MPIQLSVVNEKNYLSCNILLFVSVRWVFRFNPKRHGHVGRVEQSQAQQNQKLLYFIVFTPLGDGGN